MELSSKFESMKNLWSGNFTPLNILQRYICLCNSIYNAQWLSHVWLLHHVACNSPSSSVHGISQARMLEWVAISFSRGSSKPKDERRPPALLGGYLPLASQVAQGVKNPPTNALDLREVEVKAAQSCPTLCDPMAYTVHGILQARILEWVDIPFSSRSSQPRDQTQVSHIARGFFTSWTTRKAQM